MRCASRGSPLSDTILSETAMPGRSAGHLLAATLRTEQQKIDFEHGAKVIDNERIRTAAAEAIRFRGVPINHSGTLPSDRDVLVRLIYP